MVRVKAKAKVSGEAEWRLGGGVPCPPLCSLPPHTAVCILSSQGGIRRTGFKLLQGQSDRKPGGGSGGGKLILYGN